MYLLHIRETAEAGELDIQLELHVADVPPYAILSHRWGAVADEVSFQDLMLQKPSAKQKKGYQKVQSCCAQALEYGLNYAWIDTCCIDKSSSAELSEAINSMYAWYESSFVCFAYLEDVPSRGEDWPQRFTSSEWFKRGWTLQELIAPKEVTFFGSDWGPKPLGTKLSLARTISDITWIPEKILSGSKRLGSAGVAQKMSWASRRKTTRVEDEAYSLMGLFGVHMPTVYGEGKKAFLRLQEEIMKSSTDHTIFLWGAEKEADHHGMLVTSPKYFSPSGTGKSMFQPSTYNEYVQRYHMDSVNLEPYYTTTNSGLQIQLPIVAIAPLRGYYLAFLAVQTVHAMIILRQRDDRPTGHFIRVLLDGHSFITRYLKEAVDTSQVQTVRVLISANEEMGPSNSPLSCLQHAVIPAFGIGFKVASALHDYLIIQYSVRANRTKVLMRDRQHLDAPLALMEKCGGPIIYPRQVFFGNITFHPRGSPVLTHPLASVRVAVAFGLYGGEPWASASISKGEPADPEWQESEAEFQKRYSRYDLTSTQSVWNEKPEEARFIRSMNLEPGKTSWDFGVHTEMKRHTELRISLSERHDGWIPHYTFQFDITRLKHSSCNS